MPRRSDRPAIMMRVVAGPRLEPVGPYDAEILSAYPVGSELTVEPRKVKNNKLLAKWWAVLGRVVENTDWVSARALNKAVLMELKLVNHTRLFDGSLLVEPMSLADLDDEELSRVYDEGVNFLCEHVIRGMDRAELEAIR
jgi:hypothetical protein